jgi:hypothetical protein
LKVLEIVEKEMEGLKKDECHPTVISAIPSTAGVACRSVPRHCQDVRMLAREKSENRSGPTAYDVSSFLHY